VTLQAGLTLQVRRGGAVDLRAVASRMAVHQTLTALLSYNEWKSTTVFAEQMHTCGICLEEVAGVDFTRLPTCSHTFCSICTRTHAATHVQDGTLDLLRCPHPGCKAPLPHHLLRAVLDEEQFDRWERLTLERTLDCMVDLVYCPRCDTAVVEVRVLSSGA
jgi:E3 ubiquitin-protein ligase RNF14